MRKKLVSILLVSVALSACSQATQSISLMEQPSNMDSGWKIYRHRDYTIMYPKEMSEVGETPVATVFSPADKSIPIWLVFAQDLSIAPSLEEEIAAMGPINRPKWKRFEKRENITLDGKAALLVTVTTDAYSDSEYMVRHVFIETAMKRITIWNDPGPEDEEYGFDTFYKSIDLK